jgi:ADP-ribose pyrophosphatase
MRRKSEKIVHRGKFLSFKETTFIDRNGKKSVWESVVRNRKVKVSVIVARLKPSGRFVLIRQFRHTINNTVLGMPAGLVRGNIGRGALRELKEETGYTGKIVEVSPRFKMGAAVIDDEVHMVSVEIDEKDPRNKKPVQELEPEEDIEVVLARKQDLRRLIRSELKKGRQVSSALWYFLLGGDFRAL